jgi:hypothetical protein
MNADISVLAASGKSGRRVVAALRAAGHTPEQVRTYLNTLWLQDPDRWKALEDLPEPA